MVVALRPGLVTESENCTSHTFLLWELRNRMRNNLSVIASLLRMKAAAAADRQLRMALLETCECVDTMVMIDEKIFVANQQVMIEGSDYLHNLVHALRKAYCPEHIAIHVSTAPVRMKTSKAELLGLVVNEVLSHIFRCAFRGRAEGIVEIRLRKRSSFIELVIKDNGNGMFNEQLKRNNTQGTGLIEILTKRLEGRFSFENDSGTRFTLVFADTV
ncbi:MAG: pleD [Bacteroidetes bacterium]|nr:MAG: pleD [Bacteroidota bacterium]